MTRRDQLPLVLARAAHLLPVRIVRTLAEDCSVVSPGGWWAFSLKLAAHYRQRDRAQWRYFMDRAHEAPGPRLP